MNRHAPGNDGAYSGGPTQVPLQSPTKLPSLSQACPVKLVPPPQLTRVPLQPPPSVAESQ